MNFLKFIIVILSLSYIVIAAVLFPFMKFFIGVFQNFELSRMIVR